MRPIRTVALFFGAVASAVLLSSATARAGGVFLYEVGTPDVGYASAGYAARAEGPVTVLTNPAGMTRLDGFQVEVGTQALYGQLQFSPDALTNVSPNCPPPSVSCANGGNAVGWLPGGGLFASYAVGKDLRFGVGVFSNFGLTESWESGWGGRYYATKSTLIGLSVMPAVSYHLVAGLSLGATLNAMYGHLDFSSDINNLPLTMADGTVSVSSNTWGFGGNVGVLYEFAERSRLGLTYTSPVGLNFSAQPTYTNVRQGGLGNQTLGLGMTVPQTLMLSYYQGLGDRFALMADVGWQNWGAFGTVEVSNVNRGPLAGHVQGAYSDTWFQFIAFSVTWKS